MKDPKRYRFIRPETGDYYLIYADDLESAIENCEMFIDWFEVEGSSVYEDNQGVLLQPEEFGLPWISWSNWKYTPPAADDSAALEGKRSNWWDKKDIWGSGHDVSQYVVADRDKWKSNYPHKDGVPRRDTVTVEVEYSVTAKVPVKYASNLKFIEQLRLRLAVPAEHKLFVSSYVYEDNDNAEITFRWTITPIFDQPA